METPEQSAPNSSGPEKRKRGQPAFKPTQEQRNLVKYLAAAGVSQERICQCLRDKKGNPIEDDTLRKHFREELDTSADMITGLATSKVVHGINTNQAWAVCFWLKCRAGWREISAHQFVDEKGKDRPFLLSDADRLIAEADAADEFEGAATATSTS